MTYILPPCFLPPQSNVAYSYGPTGLNAPLVSGGYYSGWWAAWLSRPNGDNQILYRQLSDPNDRVRPDSTGLQYTGVAPASIATSNGARFSDLSLAFTPSGQPFVAYQDNLNPSVPRITVAMSGNPNALVSWTGYNPLLFAHAQVNYPYSLPSYLGAIYNTGQMVCYYSNVDGTTLFARQLNEGFLVERAVNSGLSSGSAYRMDAWAQPGIPGYVPFRALVGSVSSDARTVSVLVSKQYHNWASDDFLHYPIGTGFTVLSSGYGNWARPSIFYPSTGRTFSADVYVFDSFLLYPVGSISLLYSGDGVNAQWNKPGRFFTSDVYMDDDFLSYPIGPYQGVFNLGFSTTIALTGRLVPADTYLSDGFLLYAPGAFQAIFTGGYQTTSSAPTRGYLSSGN